MADCYSWKSLKRESGRVWTKSNSISPSSPNPNFTAQHDWYHKPATFFSYNDTTGNGLLIDEVLYTLIACMYHTLKNEHLPDQWFFVSLLYSSIYISTYHNDILYDGCIMHQWFNHFLLGDSSEDGCSPPSIWSWVRFTPLFNSWISCVNFSILLLEYDSLSLVLLSSSSCCFCFSSISFLHFSSSCCAFSASSLCLVICCLSSSISFLSCSICCWAVLSSSALLFYKHVNNLELDLIFDDYIPFDWQSP